MISMPGTYIKEAEQFGNIIWNKTPYASGESKTCITDV